MPDILPPQGNWFLSDFLQNIIRLDSNYIFQDWIQISVIGFYRLFTCVFSCLFRIRRHLIFSILGKCIYDPFLSFYCKFLSNARVSFISMQSFSFLFWNTCMTMLIASIVMKMNCFGGIIDRRKVLSLISIDRNYQILAIAKLRHTANSICTFPKLEFSLCWMKLWNSGNHYTTAPYYLV